MINKREEILEKLYGVAEELSDDASDDLNGRFSVDGTYLFALKCVLSELEGLDKEILSEKNKTS